MFYHSFQQNHETLHLVQTQEAWIAVRLDTQTYTLFLPKWQQKITPVSVGVPQMFVWQPHVQAPYPRWNFLPSAPGSLAADLVDHTLGPWAHKRWQAVGWALQAYAAEYDMASYHQALKVSDTDFVLKSAHKTLTIKAPKSLQDLSKHLYRWKQDTVSLQDISRFPSPQASSQHERLQHAASLEETLRHYGHS